MIIPPTKPDLKIEKSLFPNVIAGIDEAGRGACAGPLIVGIVLNERCEINEDIIDSKKLSKEKREKLNSFIRKNYIHSIGIASNTEIDYLNVNKATELAICRAIQLLSKKADIYIIDGNMKFSKFQYKSIIKGDQKSYSIACASIIAKVFRDNLMIQMHEDYTQYEWTQNKGYGTKRHLEAIAKHGICEYHRESYIHGAARKN